MRTFKGRIVRLGPRRFSTPARSRNLPLLSAIGQFFPFGRICARTTPRARLQLPPRATPLDSHHRNHKQILSIDLDNLPSDSQ